MTVNKWKRKLTYEDGLLSKYLKTRRRGVVFTEVPVGNAQEKGTAARRLDAVRIIGIRMSKKLERVNKYRHQRKLFRPLLKGHVAEIIEAKRNLGRSVVGQVIVGAELFKRKYKVGTLRRTVVCGRGNSAIEQVCSKLNVNVWIP